MHASVAQQVQSILAPEQQVTVFQLVRDLYDDALGYYQEFHRAMMEELEFALSLRQYEDEQGNVRHKAFIQPHSLDLFHLLRHKWAQICRADLYIECRPVDQYGDADLAEDCTFVLQHVTGDRRLRYKASRRRMVIGALSARAWGMKVEFDPRIGPFGDLVFSDVNPCDLFVAPGWRDMHDATCPWVGERSKMRVNDVLAMGAFGWDTSGVQADSTMSHGRTTTFGQVAPAAVRNSRPGQPAPGTSAQETVTVLKWWFRFDPLQETYSQTSPTLELAPEDRYYECAECGHVEMPEGMVDDEEMFPESAGPCPLCGQGEMVRADFVEEEQSFLRYPEGRLVIVCPELELVLYNDKWPVDLRSFPYMLLRAYYHPEDLYGQSDTSLLWSMVVIQNAVLRAGWEQMVRNADIIMTPLDGLVDADGNPFMFTDEQGSIAYFKDPMSAQSTQHFQGSGLSQGWGQFLMALQNAFKPNMGFNDVGLSGPQLANATMGAVETAVQQGEIPVDDHIDELNEEQSMFLGVVLDYIIGTWSVERWIRYAGFDGIQKVKRIMGSDLPYADVEVSVQPKLDPVNAEQIKSFQLWLQFDPPARMVMARLLNIPPSLVRQYEQARMEYALAMEEEAALAAEAGGGGGGMEQPAEPEPAAASA